MREGETKCVLCDYTVKDKISAAKKDRVVWTSIDLGEQPHITPATMTKTVGDPAD